MGLNLSQTSNLKTTSNKDSIKMTFSEHSNGLVSTIVCNYGRNKQYKFYSNHQLPLNINQQIKHHSGGLPFEESVWYRMNFQWGSMVQLIVGWGGGRIHKSLGRAKSNLAGIRKKTFTKIETHAGMAERMVRYLVIEEALRI